jgi:hypothetical protein
MTYEIRPVNAGKILTDTATIEKNCGIDFGSDCGRVDQCTIDYTRSEE